MFTRKLISASPVPAGFLVVTTRRNVYVWPALSVLASTTRLGAWGPERETVGLLRLRAYEKEKTTQSGNNDEPCGAHREQHPPLCTVFTAFHW